MNHTILINREIEKERLKGNTALVKGYNDGLDKAMELVAKHMRLNHHLFIEQDQYRKFFSRTAPEYSIELLKLSDQLRNEVLNVCDLLSTYPDKEIEENE